MADKRAARRDATQAARKLLQGTLLAAAADLGEAHAGLAQAREGIDDAAARGQELVRQAHEATDRLVATARENVAEVEQAYATRWREALDTGWTPAQLREMGYTTPAPRRRTVGARRSAGEPSGDGHTPGPDPLEGEARPAGGEHRTEGDRTRAEAAAQTQSGDGSDRPGDGPAGVDVPGPATTAGEDPAWQDPAAVTA